MTNRPEYMKAYRRRPERAGANKAKGLRDQYGITAVKYLSLVHLQQGRCGLCGAAGRKLVVDHNHSTGVVRALLCTPCNNGLGLFREDPVLFQRATTYVRQLGRGSW